MNNKKIILVILGIILLTFASATLAEDLSDKKVTAFVSETYAVPAGNLVVDYKLNMDIPAVGAVTQYKLRDSTNEFIYGAVINQTGELFTPEDFRKTADQAYLEKYGKLDLQLFQRYQEDQNAKIPVEIWLVVDDSLLAGLRGPDFIGQGLGLNGEPPEQGDLMDDRDGSFPQARTESDQDPAVLAAVDTLNAQVASLQSTVAARLLDVGIEVSMVQDTPALSAVLTHSQALAVAESPEVGRIFAADQENKDMNSSATGTHRAPAVWGRGYTGEGAKVAILEDSRPYQNYWLYNFVDARDWVSSNVDSHATETMGNINSSHGVHLGMARGASMYAANATDYSTANIQAAAIWAAQTNSVDIINNSWGVATPTGCLSSLGMFFDYRVIIDKVLVTFAAGSDGDLINDHAMAYNILSVGSFDDLNNSIWSDDRMSEFSAWKEGVGCSPSNGDREEPDLVAVGERIRSTGIGPEYIVDTDQSSTSYSAAMVAGAAALLLDIDPNLVDKPEAMRAILMASAVNNIEGNERLSEYDGAGGIDAYSAYLLTLNGRYAQMTINPSTWTSYDYTFYAGTDEPIACAAAWTSHPNASFTSDPLLTDLDLRLYNPDGGLIASSTSSNNNFEIVRTITDMSGTFKCRVSKYSSSGSTWEYLGIAVDRAFQYPYDYPYEESATLRVAKDGNGSGTVTSTPAGIDCGSDCSESLPFGTAITLTPTASSGSSFTGWSGACSGSGDCVVTMDADRDVTATFTLESYQLTVAKDGNGSGTVTSTPVGIDCGSDCSESFTYSTVVTLTATPDTSSTFSGWSGACSDSGDCVVTMDTAKSVTATFNPAGSVYLPLVNR